MMADVGGPLDIETFLDSNKDWVDADPEAIPYDDLRLYAYEGDGNSGGVGARVITKDRSS